MGPIRSRLVVSEAAGAALCQQAVFSIAACVQGGTKGQSTLVAERLRGQATVTRIEPPMAFDEAGGLTAPFPNQVLGRLVPQLISASAKG